MLPNPALSNPKMYYSLGVLYLAAVAQQNHHSVAVADLRNGYKPLPTAKFYGFSCTTPEINYARKIARTLRGKTIVGGAHPTVLPQDCVGQFDYTVIGEGENAILEILSGKSPYNVLVGQRVIDLDTIPYPAWDMMEDPFSDTLFPGEKYGKAAKAATLISSRGCPFHCAFCSNLYWLPVVHRSVENIIGELKALIKRGITFFRFEDDNMCQHPALEALSQEMKKLNIHYKCHIRSDLVNERRVRLLAESGCEECGMGLESADDVVLKLNNKRETTTDHFQGVKLLKSFGIRVKTYWVMGLPGETDKTLELNKQFVIDTQPDKWTVSTFTPYPGCDIYKHPRDYNIEIIDPDWAHWWNFCEELQRYNHILIGQTPEQMWDRYLEFYRFLKSGEWKHAESN